MKTLQMMLKKDSTHEIMQLKNHNEKVKIKN